MSIQVLCFSIAFLIWNNWETDLQKSMNPFLVFRNDLFENLLYYMYTYCYAKMKKSLN